MFVISDDSYLDLYYLKAVDDGSSSSGESENDVLEEEKDEKVNLGWI